MASFINIENVELVTAEAASIAEYGYDGTSGDQTELLKFEVWLEASWLPVYPGNTEIRGVQFNMNLTEDATVPISTLVFNGDNVGLNESLYGATFNQEEGIYARAKHDKIVTTETNFGDVATYNLGTFYLELAGEYITDITIDITDVAIAVDGNESLIDSGLSVAGYPLLFSNSATWTRPTPSYETPFMAPTQSYILASQTVSFTDNYVDAPVGAYEVSLMTEEYIGQGGTEWDIEQTIEVRDNSFNLITVLGEVPYTTDPHGSTKVVHSNYGALPGEAVTSVIDTFSITTPGFHIVNIQKNRTSCYTYGKISYRIRLL